MSGQLKYSIVKTTVNRRWRIYDLMPLEISVESINWYFGRCFNLNQWWFMNLKGCTNFFSGDHSISEPNIFWPEVKAKFSSIFLKSLKDFIWFVRPILYGGSRSRHRADMLLWGHTLRRRLVGSTLCQAYRGALSRSAIATASISSRYKKITFLIFFWYPNWWILSAVV